jgi:hypothetical protein
LRQALGIEIVAPGFKDPAAHTDVNAHAPINA